jgi:hypothetical protein
VIRHRTRWAAVALVLVVAAGCGGPGADEVATVEPPRAPTLPDRDATWAFGDERAWRSLASFQGSRWDDTPDAGRAVLLADTVCDHPARDTWAAAGLVRNESAGPVAITVVATLVRADGTVAEVLSTDVPVAAVRPGEPAPFLVQSATTAPTSVADVRWEVRASPVVDRRGAVALHEWWQRSAGDPRPIDMYLRREAPQGPFPYALFGAATNEGGPLGATDVVAAWLDDEQRVCWVAEVPLAAPTDRAAAPARAPRSAAAPGARTVVTTTTSPATASPATTLPTTTAPAAAPTGPDGGAPSLGDATTTTGAASPVSTTLPPPLSTDAAEADPPAAPLASGTAMDFLIVVDDPVSASFTGVVMLWAVPR